MPCHYSHIVEEGVHIYTVVVCESEMIDGRVMLETTDPIHGVVEVRAFPTEVGEGQPALTVMLQG